MRYAVIVLFSCMFVGCSSVAVSPEQISVLAREAVPETQRPDPLAATVAVEPTGFRFTFHRAAVLREVERPDGRTVVRSELASDQPLGVSLGSGLFLDAAGNLSWVPSQLAGPGRGTILVEGTFLPGGTVWSPQAAEVHTLERTSYELKLTSRGLFAPQVTKIQLGLPVLTALGWRVTQKTDGSAFQVPVSLIDFLLVPTEYAPSTTGVSVLTSTFPRQQVDYVNDGDLLRSSDGQLRIDRLPDHIRINYLGHIYLFFQGKGQRCLVDGKTGAIFRWSEDESSVVADRGWGFQFLEK